MAERYDPAQVESKWRRRWEESGAHRVDLDAAERPFYNLMMYPYPSAEGLHIGNVYAFTGADIFGRFIRLQGPDVFEPIGFDAFGIHSENFALKRGIHPTKLIPQNIANFTRQLKRMGFMYDWDRVVDVTQPEYYKWTQWIFLQLYKAKLGERREAPVNWCPSCKTVLANEQVIDGRCERCETEVTQRYLKQWFFKITDYVQRLLDNLEWIDWSDSTKRLQRNWIGRSEGADIEFPVVGHPEKLQVFTTRPDTLFGATFMVLAPEHPLVAEITTAEHKTEVDAYVQSALATDLVERKKTGAERQKTGIDTGAKAINPATGEQIPIWIADYVLMEYGHGAIMAVPAHDERDFEFAQKYALSIRTVVVPAGDKGGAGGAMRLEPPQRLRIRPTPKASCWSTRASSTECQRVRQSKRSRNGLPSAARARRPSTTGSTIGVSRGSATGDHRSPSSIAMTVGPCPCPKKIYRCCCHTSKISVPTRAAWVRWLALRNSWKSTVRSAVGAANARLTYPTRSSTRPGISCATRPQSSMTGRSIASARRSGCP